MATTAGHMPAAAGASAPWPPAVLTPTAPSSVLTARRSHDVLARNAGYLLLGQVASTVLSVVLSAALARHLGATDFGVYFLLVTMSTFAYVLVDWGQSAYLIREAARRPEVIASLLGSALAFRALAALAAVGLTVFVAAQLGYAPNIQILCALTVVCSFPLSLAQPYSYLFRGQDRMDLDASVTVSAKALTVALTVSVLLLGGHLVSVIVAQGLGGAGGLAAALLLARRQRLPRPRATREGIGELAVGGASIAVFLIAIAVQPYIDAIVLSKLAPSSVVGWYGAAKNVMGLLVTPASILAAAAFPEFSRTASDLPRLRDALRKALRPVIGLGTLAAVGTFLFADLTISIIYGRAKFGPAATILELFAPMALLFFVDIVLGSVVTAIGRTRVLALAKVANVGVSTALGLLLVPACQRWFGNGALGIVLAFGASEMVMLVAYLWVIPPAALDRGFLVDLGRAALAGAGTLAVFRLLPPLAPWVALPLAVVLFGAFAVVAGLVTPLELAQVASLASRRASATAAVAQPS